MTDLLNAFEDWLAEHGGSLPAPLFKKSRAAGSISLGFVGFTPAIEVLVHSGGIVVLVMVEGRCRDILTDYEFGQETWGDSVASSLCDPAHRKVFPSESAMIVDHIMRPFAEWVKAVLVTAHSIGLGSSASAETWATLLRESQVKGYSRIIPLRT